MCTPQYLPRPCIKLLFTRVLGVNNILQVIALYLRSKRRQEERLSTEETEISPNSESLPCTQKVLEGETEGLNTKTMESVMDAIHHDGDRVAMARASRSEEEHYARTACNSSNSLKCSFSYARS